MLVDQAFVKVVYSKAHFPLCFSSEIHEGSYQEMVVGQYQEMVVDLCQKMVVVQVAWV